MSDPDLLKQLWWSKEVMEDPGWSWIAWIIGACSECLLEEWIQNYWLNPLVPSQRPTHWCTLSCSGPGLHEEEHKEYSMEDLVAFPWRRRLEAKVKAAQREVSQFSELQKGSMKRELPKKYNKLPTPEELETSKQRLTALVAPWEGTLKKPKPGV